MPSYYDAAAAQAVYPYAQGYGYPMAPWGYNIVGQDVKPPPDGGTTTKTTTTTTEESLTTKGQNFLKKETFGIKNQNILLGAAVLGGLYWGYEAGWFGGKTSSARDPRHHRSHRRSHRRHGR